MLVKDAASLGVSSPSPTAVIITACAARRSLLVLILGKSTLTVRSRRGGASRANAICSAVALPLFAIAISLPVSPLAAPSSIASTRSVTLLREPFGRPGPPGLPAKNRPRAPRGVTSELRFSADFFPSGLPGLRFVMVARVPFAYSYSPEHEKVVSWSNCKFQFGPESGRNVPTSYSTCANADSFTALFMRPAATDTARRGVLVDETCRRSPSTARPHIAPHVR